MKLEHVRTARTRRWLMTAALTLIASCPWRAGLADETLIPYEKFKLDNGLTVIVHTDRKAPIVALNLWYHVGSKTERLGKTGFAHLFEHLMFQGSENYNDEFFKPMEEVGATSINGTTNFDRTNYLHNVPTTALELALWMESDRMGHLLGAIDQARLDEQRGVVKNEKRQGENQPYGRVFASVVSASFPADHPYHWLPIGSMEDLDAASLDDVKEWFRTYYGAANAVLVLAGDIDVATARTQAQKYFGHIPPGPATTRPETWVAARTESTRETMYDQVAQTRLHRFWNTPEDGTTEADLLVLAQPDEKSADALSDSVDAAMFETGRPLVLIPSGVSSVIGNRIMIAWNGSAQAALAVTAALPLLHLAGQVDIVQIGDIGKDAPASELALYLSLHGIKTQTHAIDLGIRDIGSALIDAAERFESDLIVMGAYGHSRFRERILGGATRDLLKNSPWPILMMH